MKKDHDMIQKVLQKCGKFYHFSEGGGDVFAPKNSPLSTSSRSLEVFCKKVALLRIR
jgi:hypothetical protein